MTPRNIKWYGWKPQTPDFRDLVFRPKVTKLPSSIDLRSSRFMPPVVDQGDLGSCTANAIAGAFQYEVRKQSLTDITPSRLFIYYNERVLEGTVSFDAGAEIRDGMKTINKQGVCRESEWAYDITRFADRPSGQCYTDALSNLSTSYFKLASQSSLIVKASLALSFPVVFGFAVYSSFESNTVATNGIVPMPGRNDEFLGGHACVIVGYDDRTQRYIVRNSWGTDWGMAGYFTIPYNYLSNTNLAGDFWTIRVVT